MDDQYWQNFYKTFQVNKPSDFAVFAAKYLKLDDKVLELGCGNGRDAYYLSRHCESVVGIDANNKPDDVLNVSFQQSLVEKVDIGVADVVYARFFLHSVPQEVEEIILKRCAGMLLAEFRSDRGVSPSNDHYRRLINFHKFLNRLYDNGFQVVFATETNGLAVFGDEDPIVIRVVATKNGE